MGYKNFNLLIWLVLLITLCGCKDTIHVKNVGKYSNGTTKEIEYYRNKEETPFAYIKYYENGDTMEVSRYINATDEQWIPYYQNGKIRGRVTYRHINYVDTIWNSDHTKVEYSTTLDSKYKIDTVFEYTDSGFIYTMQIIDGKCPDTLCCCDGIHLEFENGKLSQRYHMKSRNTDGLHEYFYPNGRLRYQVYLVDGDANGPSKTYFENGKPESEGNYQNCKKEGQWRYWEANGSWRIVNYFRDTLNGVTTEYNTSGPNLWVKGQYKDGKEIGRWYSYDKDTILKSHHDY